MDCNYRGWCNNGQCMCEWNFGNCDGTWLNGCETDLNTSVNHCGACNNPCGQNAYCNMGQCKCNDCFANCDQWPGCETEICYNNYNCGSCNYICPSDMYCNFKICIK
jgi:hypothetical protein